MDMNKVICPCLDITVQQIKDAIDNGARSYEDVEEATGVGTVCGVCIDEAKEVVAQLLKK